MALALRQDSDDPLLGEPEAKKARYELTPALEQALIQVPQHERLTGLAGPSMRLVGHGGAVYGCEFSPDGKRLASCSFDNKIFLWNVYGDAENYGCLQGHNNAVLEVHWSADQQQVYSCSADKSCAVWDAETGQRIKKLNGHTAIVNSMQRSRRGDPMLVSGGDDGSTKLWDLRIRKCVHSFDHQYQILGVCFDDTAEKIFAASLDDTIRVFDVRSRADEELYVLEGHSDSITGIDLSPDGEKLISNSMDQTVRMWDVRPFIPHGESRCIGIVQGHTHNYEKNLLRCRWSKDGTVFGAGSSDRMVYVWSANSLELQYQLPGHEGSVNDIAFHPKERILCSGSSDQTMFMGELGL
ncbi:unnamed protein product [Amoebophrya sp. A120]|nr:unnamed protein product [Amoebophrya sp. A120]|eukprot:GSA120T00011213001.1